MSKKSKIAPAREEVEIIKPTTESDKSLLV